MTIWILAILLLASLAGLGYRQGAIRVAFSLVAILLGAALAVPLARFVRPGLTAIGVKNPTLVWLIAPVIVFVVISIIFKVGALAAYKKVEIYYKYKAGDLRLALWERLNRRVGLCLGLVNGAAYLVLISFVIYILSYWSVQITSPDTNPRSVRILDRLGNDLQGTGMLRVARAIDHMPADYYEAADLAGTAYHTPLLAARLSSYPAFLDLGEKPEFQSLGSDNQFNEMWQKQAPITGIMNLQNVQTILHNPDLLKTIWATVTPNMNDLRAYLTNGISAKYDSMKLVGRWDFDVNGTIALVRKAHPTIPSSEMHKYKTLLAASFANTSFVATPENNAFLKNVPHVKVTPGQPPSTEMQSRQGTWKKTGNNSYEVTLTNNGQTEQLNAERQANRLTLIGEGTQLAFDREE